MGTAIATQSSVWPLALVPVQSAEMLGSAAKRSAHALWRVGREAGAHARELIGIVNEIIASLHLVRLATFTIGGELLIK